MCGIAGIYQPSLSLAAREARAAGMNDAIRHRGPDDGGIWSDETITLAHRRLAIIDLSGAGAQPMASAAGDWVISFNGEIYNYEDIRRELRANWRGHSDTEVIAEGLQQWGFEATLQKLNGMFALAAWHRPSRTLYLARDRLGEKPLYYAHFNGCLVFASELAALMTLPDLPRAANPLAVNALLMHRYIPAPLCILDGVQKLQAAHYARFSGGAVSMHRYWELPRAGSLQISEADLETEISARILQSAKLRMISDVPLGAFLSGGIDSSAVVAAMRQFGEVRTYTIGFDDPRYDEAPIARKVAAALGTRHTEFKVSDAELLNLIPQLPRAYSEPFADFSQIPTLALCQHARREVTVALAGDGGDECFAGYPRIHDAVRDFAPNALAGAAADTLAQCLPFTARKTVKKLSLAAQTDFADYYDLRSATWHARSRIAPPPFPRADILGEDNFLTANQMELQRYLPEDVLVKTDRASMAASLEVRAPFLDHTLVEFLWSLPPAQRAQHQPKGLLRNFLRAQIPVLPDTIFTRPKQGFEPPLAVWLRGPLRDWAEELLKAPHPHINMSLVRKYWHAMCAHKKSLHNFIWPVLMLRAWEVEFGP